MLFVDIVRELHREWFKLVWEECSWLCPRMLFWFFLRQHQCSLHLYLFLPLISPIFVL